ncbi:MAG: hypothetical protein RL322_1381 [Pseudomonadota bacterium]
MNHKHSATDPLPATPAIASAAEAVTDLRTVRDLVRWGYSTLACASLAFGQGTLDPRQDAEALTCWSLGLSPENFHDWLDCRLTLHERQAIVRLIERRRTERIPVAYLTGEAWLAGVCFRSDSRALIPRSLIAETLSEGFSSVLDARRVPSENWPGSVLDLCTGGGSLAILAALAFPSATVTGVDLSESALALAAENVNLQAVSEQITLLQGDLFDPVAGQKFDLILCNPPYVNDLSMYNLPDEFLAEPRTALAGGPDGMDLVRQILSRAAAHLSAGGVLILEIGHECAHFEAAFPTLEHHWLPVSAGEHMVALIERRQLIRAFQPAR